MTPEVPSAGEGEAAMVAHGRSRGGCLLVLLLLLAGGIAHWAFWYRTRPHALAPADSALLREGADLPVRLWVPYPHQNLGALGGAFERPREVLAAAARVAGLPPPNLPRLGPFGFPAGRELLVAASRDGHQLRGAVRFYPTTAVLVRLSGLLARNPWLAGGPVTVAHRPARTWWDGLTWRVASEGLPATAALPAGEPTSDPPASQDARPAFALLELREPSPPLPAGRYTLRSEGNDLVWRLGEPLAVAGPGSLAPPWFLLWVRRPAGAGQALLLFEPQRSGLLENLPAAAAWAPSGDALRLLPGGRMLHQLTHLEAAPLGSGELAATEASAGDLARSLSPRWLPVAEGTTRPPLALGGWLAVGPGAQQAQQLHDVLRDIPFLGPEEAQRWGDVATLLRAAHRYRTLSCWLTADGRQGELRLAR